ncbi:hypothetical protein PRIPAC_97341 [Pristionchus pacificus]|uniref:Uncharacterized protein n=1 Tax=Pristionchus pacificus TaxID=54126 RepID=A0A2A6CHB4_PRIPA|nr:hypothetical protein PRIPAC_97341 [Pristionchus pacificus]|eukprot:PDM77453.1 hypothetical protein PRIPAC_33183 [Pristionchus pacificus]
MPRYDISVVGVGTLRRSVAAHSPSLARRSMLRDVLNRADAERVNSSSLDIENHVVSSSRHRRVGSRFRHGGDKKKQLLLVRANEGIES